MVCFFFLSNGKSNALSTAFFAFLWIFIFYLSTIILIILTRISHKVYIDFHAYFYSEILLKTLFFNT